MMITVNSTEIHIVPAGKQPDVDAIVEEQDTYLILGTDPFIQDTKENYGTLVKKMQQQKPLIPGQVLVKNTTPKKFVVIIYDIEKKPACHEEWLILAFENILKLCAEHKINTLAMPLLGHSHGKIEPRNILDLLQNTINRVAPNYPASLYINSVNHGLFQ